MRLPGDVAPVLDEALFAVLLVADDRVMDTFVTANVVGVFSLVLIISDTPVLVVTEDEVAALEDGVGELSEVEVVCSSCIYANSI